jgi:hypothetical protein
VLAGFAVKVEDLPAYMPHLKGSVETVNGAASERMFVAGLPRYTKAPRLANGRPVDCQSNRRQRHRAVVTAPLRRTTSDHPSR